VWGYIRHRSPGPLLAMTGQVLGVC
jgi:hypothetical protein